MNRLKINNKEYEMKRMPMNEYLNYLDAAEIVNSAEGAGYTRKHFELMMQWIVRAYDDQFSVEDIMNPETGLDPADIITEFIAIDLSVADKVNKKVAKLQKNFMKRK